MLEYAQRRPMAKLSTTNSHLKILRSIFPSVEKNHFQSRSQTTFGPGKKKVFFSIQDLIKIAREVNIAERAKVAKDLEWL